MLAIKKAEIISKSFFIEKKKIEHPNLVIIYIEREKLLIYFKFILICIFNSIESAIVGVLF